MSATAGISGRGIAIELRVTATPMPSRVSDPNRAPRSAESVCPPSAARPMNHRNPPIPRAARIARPIELRAAGWSPRISCTEASTAPASATAEPVSAREPGRSPVARASPTGTSAPHALTGETMLIVPVASAW